MSEFAPPSPARSGGATSPHSGMVPRPAASQPQPAGVLRAGKRECPPCKLAPAGLPSSRGLSWSREELDRLAALRAEGRTRAECAAILGRPLWGVDGAIKRRALPRVRGPKWTAGELRTLLRMKIARHTVADIAAQIGRTPRSTSRKWQEISHKLPAGLAAEIHRDMIRLGGRRAKGAA